MSAEETVLNLFDAFWFECGVFTSKPPFTIAKPAPVSQEPETDEPKLNRIATLLRKSHSAQCFSSEECSSDTGYPSPKSILGPHLQTILSGKEVDSFEESSPKEDETSLDIGGTQDRRPRFSTKPDRVREKRRKRRKSTGSRSLSELELEELKGFMDLGFVFSDDDKDKRLVSIIPGLQRLGKNVQDLDRESETSVSRPYLSEAWDCLEDEGREKNPSMNWRIPVFGVEMELKDHLKCWAHAVASTVR